MNNEAKEKWDSIPRPWDVDDRTPRLLRLADFKDTIRHRYDGDPEALVCDLLTDIRHLCIHLGLDFDVLDSIANENFREERDDA